MIKSEEEYYQELFLSGSNKPESFRYTEKIKEDSDWFHEFKYDLLELISSIYSFPNKASSRIGKLYLQMASKNLTKKKMDELKNRSTPKYKSLTNNGKRIIDFLNAGNQRNASRAVEDFSEFIYDLIYLPIPYLMNDEKFYKWDSRSGYFPKLASEIRGMPKNIEWDNGNLYYNQEEIQKQYNIDLGKWKAILKAEAKKLHLEDKEIALEDEIQSKNELKREKEAELKRLEGLKDNAGIVDLIRQIEDGETDFMPDEIWDGYERLSETGLVIKANEMLSQIKSEQEQIKDQTNKAKEIANEDIQKILHEILSFKAKDEALVDEEIKTYAKIKRESVLIKENMRRRKLISEIKKSFIPRTNQLKKTILESIKQ